MFEKPAQVRFSANNQRILDAFEQLKASNFITPDQAQLLETDMLSLMEDRVQATTADKKSGFLKKVQTWMNYHPSPWMKWFGNLVLEEMVSPPGVHQSAKMILKTAQDSFSAVPSMHWATVVDGFRQHKFLFTPGHLQKRLVGAYAASPQGEADLDMVGRLFRRAVQANSLEVFEGIQRLEEALSDLDTLGSSPQTLSDAVPVSSTAYKSAIKAIEKEVQNESFVAQSIKQTQWWEERFVPAMTQAIQEADPSGLRHKLVTLMAKYAPFSSELNDVLQSQLAQESSTQETVLYSALLYSAQDHSADHLDRMQTLYQRYLNDTPRPEYRAAILMYLSPAVPAHQTFLNEIAVTEPSEELRILAQDVIQEAVVTQLDYFEMSL